MANRSEVRRTLRANAIRQRNEGRILDALKTLDTLIGQKLAKADDWCLTGNLLCQIGEFAQSIGAYEQCLLLEPDHLEATHELGRSLYRLGSMDRCAGYVERAAEKTQSYEIYAGWSAIAPSVPSYNHAKIQSIRKRYAELVRCEEAPLLNLIAPKLCRKQQISVGYLSAHFHGANYMKPVWPVINAHDTDQFQITLFDDSSNQESQWDWLTNASVQRVSTGSLSNRQAAEVIQAHEIDILVDLSAHSAPRRLGIFAHQPAPLSVAWFNQFATSGFSEFRYLLGDATVIRDDEEPWYDETVLRLPLSYLTFQTNHAVPDVATRPVAEGQPFVFGSLGTMYKINENVIEAWAKILGSSPNAKLLLSNQELKSKWNREWLLDQFVKHGIERHRIDIRPPASHFEFLRYYDLIDLSLDTFPYNGGTTTMESIWQGVPVLTFNGDRWASRTSQSLLLHSPLKDFVAEDLQGYIDSAVRIANSLEERQQLADLRLQMRDQLTRSSVCDSNALTRGLEQIYRDVIEQKLKDRE